MLRYYHYRKLSSNAQNAYAKIAFALKRYSSAAVIDTVPNLQKVLDAVRDDNPHFFYVDWGAFLYGSRMQAEKTVIYFKYRIQRTVAKQYLEQINVIAEGLKSNSDYSTMRKVHDYLAKTVTYFYGQFFYIAIMQKYLAFRIEAESCFFPPFYLNKR